MTHAILILHPDYTECAIFDTKQKALDKYKDETKGSDFINPDEQRIILVEPIIGRSFGVGNYGEIYGAKVVMDSHDYVNHITSN